MRNNLGVSPRIFPFHRSSPRRRRIIRIAAETTTDDTESDTAKFISRVGPLIPRSAAPSCSEVVAGTTRSFGHRRRASSFPSARVVLSGGVADSPPDDGFFRK